MADKQPQPSVAATNFVAIVDAASAAIKRNTEAVSQHNAVLREFNTTGDRTRAVYEERISATRKYVTTVQQEEGEITKVTKVLKDNTAEITKNNKAKKDAQNASLAKASVTQFRKAQAPTPAGTTLAEANNYALAWQKVEQQLARTGVAGSKYAAIRDTLNGKITKATQENAKLTQSVLGVVKAQSQFGKEQARIAEQTARANKAIKQQTANLRQQSSAAKGSSAATQGLTLSWQTFERLVIARLLTRAMHSLLTEIRQSTVEAADFMIAIGEVQTIAGAVDRTANAMSRISTQALAFSSAMGFTKEDTIEAFYFNLSNQVEDTVSALANFNIAAAQLGKITSSSLENASNAISSVLNAYKLGSEQSGLIAANLFTIIEEGRIRLDQFANTIGRVIVPASELGVPLDVVGALLATITIQGITARESLTGLRNVFFKLVQPTEEMKNTFDEWGISTGKMAVATFGAAGTFGKLNEEAAKGSEHLVALMGRLRAVQGLMAATGDAFVDFEDNFRKMGEASLERFEENWELVFQNNGEVAQREMNKVKNAITATFGINLVNAFAGAIKEGTLTAETLAKVAKTAIITGTAIAGMAVSIATANLVIGAFNALLITTTTAMTFTAIAPVAIGLVTALGIAFAGAGLLAKDASVQINQLRADIERLSSIEQKKIADAISIENLRDQNKIDKFYQGVLQPLAKIRAEHVKIAKAYREEFDLATKLLKTDNFILKTLEKSNDFIADNLRRSGQLASIEQVYGINLSVGLDALKTRLKILQESQKVVQSTSESHRDLMDDRILRGREEVDQVDILLKRYQDISASARDRFQRGDIEGARKDFERAADALKQADSISFKSTQDHLKAWEDYWKDVDQSNRGRYDPNKDQELRRRFENLSKQDNLIRLLPTVDQFTQDLNELQRVREESEQRFIGENAGAIAIQEQISHWIEVANRIQAVEAITKQYVDQLLTINDLEGISEEERQDLIAQTDAEARTLLGTETDIYEMKRNQVEQQRQSLLLQTQQKKALEASEREEQARQQVSEAEISASQAKQNIIDTTKTLLAAYREIFSKSLRNIPSGATQSGDFSSFLTNIDNTQTLKDYKAVVAEVKNLNDILAELQTTENLSEKDLIRIAALRDKSYTQLVQLLGRLQDVSFIDPTLEDVPSVHDEGGFLDQFADVRGQIDELNKAIDALTAARQEAIKATAAGNAIDEESKRLVEGNTKLLEEEKRLIDAKIENTVSETNVTNENTQAHILNAEAVKKEREERAAAHTEQQNIPKRNIIAPEGVTTPFDVVAQASSILDFIESESKGASQALLDAYNAQQLVNTSSSDLFKSLMDLNQQQLQNIQEAETLGKTTIILGDDTFNLATAAELATNMLNNQAEAQRRLNEQNERALQFRVNTQNVVPRTQEPARFVAGGPVGTDTIPAWLSPGEFVVKASAAKKNFYQLSMINAGHQPPSSQYYNHGGVVTQTFKNTFNNNTQANGVPIRKIARELQRQIGRGTITLGSGRPY